jgi:glutaredoxin
LRVCVYVRQGCHLCDDAERLLAERQPRYGFTVEAVDVDADPALAERYGLCVPVVTVNGRERFRGRVAPALLDRLLRAEAGRRS